MMTLGLRLVFPVSTGMNRAAVGDTGANVGVPRIHGDEPFYIVKNSMTVQVFPVSTGMNRIYRHEKRRPDRVPRIHGDEPCFNRLSAIASLCSPYPRG